MGDLSVSVATKTAAPAASLQAGLLQRKCACGTHTIADGECESCKKETAGGGTLRRSAANPERVDEAPPIVHEVLRSTGHPLDTATRSFMEPRFAHDFSNVRVHTDARAAESARTLNALAYTVGRDLVFATGQYRPHSSEGRRLLAHELAHAVQQPNTGHNPGLQHRLRVGDEDDPAEREADAMAERSLAWPTMQAPSSQRQVNALQSDPVTTPTIQRRVSPKWGTIKDKLTYGLTDLAITNKDARAVLNILKALSDQDLKDTVAAMEKAGLVGRFFANLPDADVKANQDALRRIQNARVYTTVTKSGGKSVTTTTTGSCSPNQTGEIFAVAREAVRWLDKAVGQMDAYLAKPNDAGNKAVGDALSTYFNSKTTNIATFVRGQVNRFRSDIKALSAFTLECHGRWDGDCDKSNAYVPGDNAEMIVFCNSFFKKQGNAADSQVSTIVHEVAHTQVGRADITDRAYISDRFFKHLTTEEALTNADSYALFVRELNSGGALIMTLPGDTFEDCPDEWRPALDKALFVVQRWNREVQVSVANLTPDSAKRDYSAYGVKLIEGTTQRGIDSHRKAVNKVAEALSSSIDFQCEPKGGGRCSKNTVAYWYAAGDLHICPSWIREAPADQAVDLLGALYGDEAGVSGETRLSNYARFAQHSAKHAAPTREEILGSAAWSADALRIVFEAQQPTTAKRHYIESGTDHERLSSDLATYRATACKATLPFRFGVWFYVDNVEARPAPFTPPRVRVEFRFVTPTGPDRKSFNDPRAHYKSTGFGLETKIQNRFALELTKNGPFEMRFELQDPDTGITRVYEDTIQIEAELPCP